ncbi:MAG: hypothetical protein JST48_03795 [Bacteroidetes bacterium]|nr:hypothetical protein [Bacteroidota bacterium]
MRTIVVALLSFLLVGPILKLTHQISEKPEVVLLIDNSASLKGMVDSSQFQNHLNEVKAQLKKSGFDVMDRGLNGGGIKKLEWNQRSSDLTGALKQIVADREGKNLSSIILFSDGIYNSGTSPVYTSWPVPIHTVGIGDTIEHPDLILKNVAYNKIAYQGNRFPVKAEVVAQKLPNTIVKVTVYKNGTLAGTQSKETGNKTLLDFDFLIDAAEKGMNRIDVVVAPTGRSERNLQNNSASTFVDVVDGRKKILLIAPAPHPDIKALRAVVEKNPNYELMVHIPGITKTDSKYLTPGQTELIIFHQPFDADMKTTPLYTTFSKSKTSLLLILGGSTNLRVLAANGVPLKFENTIQKDKASPIANTSFHDFDFSETNFSFSKFPPLQVPFGKITFPPQARVLLNQRIGSVATDRPMLLAWDEGNRKTAAFIGDGLWQWRMEEFYSTEKTELFDDTFSKLIQYLSSLEDKRKFKFFPEKNEFTDATPPVFTGQVYNDLYEKIYGNKIDIELKDEEEKTTRYSYTLSPGAERYRLGSLKAGSYHYTASTIVNDKKETVSGQFLVAQQNIEPQNLVADFGLLRKLSAGTGGKFYSLDDFGKLISDFQRAEAKTIVHSEDTLNPLIHLKLFFFLLLFLISAEWFVRKYSGGY